MADQDHDFLVSSFCDLTSASAQQATRYLSANNWDLEAAAAAFFADQEESAADSPTSGSPEQEPEYTGPRTLDGRPAPQQASSSSRAASKKPQKKTGLATLSSLGGGHNDDHEDEPEEDEDEEDGRRPRDLFAGGEKSGLAVQDPSQKSSSSDPRKLINDIVSKAKANSKRPDTQPVTPSGPPIPRFRGAGQTLGGDGVESRSIPDPHGSPIPSSRNEAPPQERILHLWNDGFSIDDGELRRFDDPQNALDLRMIRQGRAPLHLMDVRYDQPVDVKLQQHQEDYHPPPKVYRPFGGSGHRLGSPVPGDGSAGTTTTAAAPAAAPAASPATTPASASASSSAETPSTSVNESQPTLMLRIQMPDGTRLPARFNTADTVDDVYQFVRRASPDTNSRPWVLATTFPNKEHTDKTLVLGEMPEFKRGGTAVVKWA